VLPETKYLIGCAALAFKWLLALPIEIRSGFLWVGVGMGIFGGLKRHSTKKASVFSFRKEPAFEKRIQAACAKRPQRIDKFLAGATEEDKSEFLSALSGLDKMIRHYATVSERILLFFDNNVLQDMLKHEQPEMAIRKARFHALLAFLTLVQDHYLLDIFACVSPAVLYEAAHRGTRPADIVHNEVVNLVADVGLTLHAVGYRDERGLCVLFKKIRKDEREIRRALDEIKARSWVRNFACDDSRGTRIPFSLAEEDCPPVRLGYFKPWYVKLLLMHLIEKRMFHENSDQVLARRLMRNPKDKAFGVLRIKGDGVEGLGDIELLTYCDLVNQTLHNSPDITMGITFDNNLSAALWDRSKILERTSIIGGVDDISDGVLRFTYMAKKNQLRIDKANARLAEYASAFMKYIDTIRHHFDLAEQ